MFQLLKTCFGLHRTPATSSDTHSTPPADMAIAELSVPQSQERTIHTSTFYPDTLELLSTLLRANGRSPPPKFGDKIAKNDYRRLLFPVFRERVLVAQRLATFDNWPPSNAHKPMTLAKASFFYAGKSDQITCYHCGGCLYGLQPEDDVNVEHKRHFPDCAVVQIYLSGSTRLPTHPSSLNSVPAVPTIRLDLPPGQCQLCHTRPPNTMLHLCDHHLCTSCRLLSHFCPLCSTQLPTVQLPNYCQE